MTSQTHELDKLIAEEAAKIAAAVDRDLLNSYLPPEKRLPDLWHTLRTIDDFDPRA